MKSILEVCLLLFATVSVTVPQQNPSKPAFRPGISVKMPVSRQAAEVPAADDRNATVVSITADGKLFVGTQPAQTHDLGKLNAQTVYIKADSRAPYQTVLTVLEALHGHALILLAAPASKPPAAGITPPYGVSVSLGVR